jgi:trehalose/maltose hydrolase-like predicted phosphorylase
VLKWSLISIPIYGLPLTDTIVSSIIIDKIISQVQSTDRGIRREIVKSPIELFQSILSTGNYDRLISASTNEIVTIWEKVLLKCGFNRVCKNFLELTIYLFCDF